MEDEGRSKKRTKTLEATPLGQDGFRFEARLTDRARRGNFDGDEVTIHDFAATGVVQGPRLTLAALQIEALAHPYEDCPFAVPPAHDLVGTSVMSGWRRAVLDALGGPSGCTHVNTLLLGLSELTTIVIFLKVNPAVPYDAESRADGRWIRGAHAVAPGLANACYALRGDGSTMRHAGLDINTSVD